MKTKEDLLLMPVWTYKEIMEYFPEIKSKTTAIRIKNRAIKELYGSVPYGFRYVKSNSVLMLYGTTREREIELIKRKTENEKNHQ